MTWSAVPIPLGLDATHIVRTTDQNHRRPGLPVLRLWRLDDLDSLVVLRDKAVRLFGILNFVSIFLTWFTYRKTFNSVWCFYCAILSIFILWIVNRPCLQRSAAC